VNDPEQRIAIIIATMNRGTPLRDTVSDVVQQMAPSDEMLVVDHSDPVVASLNARWLQQNAPAVRWLRDSTRGLPRARNLGLHHSTAPIVLFFDDDVRVHRGTVSAHRSRYRDPCVGGVVGKILERQARHNARSTENRIDWGGRVKTFLQGRHAVRIATLKGCNMSFRRRALSCAGFFDEGYRGTAFLEDADMSVRIAQMGWELWFEPTACVDHLSAPSGGARTGDAQRTEWWRFHNTGYFVGRHRGMLHLPQMVTIFGAVAALRAFEWRRPVQAAALLDALRQGWRLARHGQ